MLNYTIDPELHGCRDHPDRASFGARRATADPSGSARPGGRHDDLSERYFPPRSRRGRKSGPTGRRRRRCAEAGSQIVPLRFASARQLATLARTLCGRCGRTVGRSGPQCPDRNRLAFGTTERHQPHPIFDVDYLAGQSYALFPAKSGDPNKIVQELGAALQLTDGPLAGAIRLVAINEANAIMVIAQQPDLSRSCRPADRPVRPGEGDRRPKHPRLLSEERASRRSSTDLAARREPAKRQRNVWRDCPGQPPADRDSGTAEHSSRSGSDTGGSPDDHNGTVTSRRRRGHKRCAA